MRRSAIISIALLFSGGLVCGQTPENKHADFDKFKKGILDNYGKFKKTILDNYADFLDGEWHEYQSLNGLKRSEVPKPKVLPVVEDDEPIAEPQPEPIPLPIPEPETQPQPEPEPIHQPEEPAVVEEPVVVEEEPLKPEETFQFYTTTLPRPEFSFDVEDQLFANTDYAANWRRLTDQEVAKHLLPDLDALAKALGLNDYLKFRLFQHYLDAALADKDVSTRFSTLHYLLANAGYDVRIACNADGMPLILVPFNQMVYARPYLRFDTVRYYIFGPDNVPVDKLTAQRIYTCTIPSDMKAGRLLELKVDPLHLPNKPKEFNLSYGILSLKGELNENIMPLLYEYPQMPIEDFALSCPMPELRANLVEQVKNQLSGMSGDEAVGVLLKFMHKAFSYSIDEDFHGFEKPYFLEENFYYPKNDCEDRSIFYTYFLWNALGREAQLVGFPGHEAATVRLDNPVSGTSYEQDGVTFYMSDPTYIGSRTGMVMPCYKDTPPEIDHTYK